LTISRVSLAAIVQESIGPSTIRFPAGDDGHLDFEHVIDLLERRRIRSGAAARQELRTRPRAEARSFAAGLKSKLMKEK